VLGRLLVERRVAERALGAAVVVHEQLVGPAIEIRHERAAASGPRELGERRLRAHGW
jgi:hypothetical protein